MKPNHPLQTLKHHVTGAIERGEKQPIVGIPMKSKYNYRVTSIKAGSFLQPQTATMSLHHALSAVEQHSDELPGCITRIDKWDGREWKLWDIGTFDQLIARDSR